MAVASLLRASRLLSPSNSALIVYHYANSLEVHPSGDMLPGEYPFCIEQLQPVSGYHIPNDVSAQRDMFSVAETLIIKREQ